MMTRINRAATVLAACAGLLSAAVARAEPTRPALVIGNATYAALPGIPACVKSANTISAALRALNFQVTEREDASTGGVDAAISEFARDFAAGGVAFVYFCGYGTDFNNRTFLLPITARIARPSDVMTQGVLAKSLLTAVSRDPAAAAVVVFDMVATPGGPRIDLDALSGIAVPDGVGIIAAAEAPPSDNPTPLAAALVAALAGPRVDTGAVLNSVRTQLAGGPVAAVHMPVRTAELAGPPTTPAAAAPGVRLPPAAPAVQVPAAGPAAQSPGAAPAAQVPSTAPATPTGAPTPQTPTAAAPGEQLPDEAAMTEGDRRKAQAALVRLGYYAAPVDGAFGPETRAAIRRYQHEIGAETTGHLTADQASRLVNSR